MNLRRAISTFILVCFFTTNVQTSFMASPAYAQNLVLPKPGIMVHLSQSMNPPILKGIKVHPDNPFRFDFILDKGDTNDVGADLVSARDGRTQGSPLRTESTKLIKYFLASLTTPEGDLWVNLSPYEKDRIVPTSFGQTEMGRDLLAQDYMLKQITASLIYPEDELGKKFWKRIYEEAQLKYGTTNIPVNTFNKVWIVPEKAMVYENSAKNSAAIDGAGHTAYVVESRLKVMLEVDYLSLEKHTVKPVVSDQWSVISEKQHPKNNPLTTDHPMPAGRQGSLTTEQNNLGSQIVREIVIPALTREVNEGANFAQLRQVYNSLILATWYKKKIKDSILAKVYADQNKVAGVGYDQSVVLTAAKDHKEPLGSLPAVRQASVTSSFDKLRTRPERSRRPSLPQDDTERIYNQYLSAFKKGVYNYIKDEPDLTSGQRVPRKYFSGGMSLFNVAPTLTSATPQQASQAMIGSDRAMLIEMDANPILKAQEDSAMTVAEFFNYVTKRFHIPVIRPSDQYDLTDKARLYQHVKNETPERKAVLEKIIDRIQYVSQAELESRLKPMVIQLNKELAQYSSYGVLFEEFAVKSRTWMYTLAIPWLDRAPSRTAIYFDRDQLKRLAKEPAVVLFDDISVNGSLNGIATLKELNPNIKIYIAIPYITQKVIDMMKEKYGDTVVFLKDSDGEYLSTIVPQVKDILSAEELALFDTEKREIHPEASIYTFQHNVPDVVTFPKILREAVRNQPPGSKFVPYKRRDTPYFTYVTTANFTNTLRFKLHQWRFFQFGDSIFDNVASYRNQPLQSWSWDQFVRGHLKFVPYHITLQNGQEFNSAQIDLISPKKRTMRIMVQRRVSTLNLSEINSIEGFIDGDPDRPFIFRPADEHDAAIATQDVDHFDDKALLSDGWLRRVWQRGMNQLRRQYGSPFQVASYDQDQILLRGSDHMNPNGDVSKLDDDLRNVIAAKRQRTSIPGGATTEMEDRQRTKDLILKAASELQETAQVNRREVKAMRQFVDRYSASSVVLIVESTPARLKIIEEEFEEIAQYLLDVAKEFKLDDEIIEDVLLSIHLPAVYLKYRGGAKYSNVQIVAPEEEEAGQRQLLAFREWEKAKMYINHFVLLPDIAKRMFGIANPRPYEFKFLDYLRTYAPYVTNGQIVPQSEVEKFTKGMEIGQVRKLFEELFAKGNRVVEVMRERNTHVVGQLKSYNDKHVYLLFGIAHFEHLSELLDKAQIIRDPMKKTDAALTAKSIWNRDLESFHPIGSHKVSIITEEGVAFPLSWIRDEEVSLWVSTSGDPSKMEIISLRERDQKLIFRTGQISKESAEKTMEDAEVAVDILPGDVPTTIVLGRSRKSNRGETKKVAFFSDNDFFSRDHVEVKVEKRDGQSWISLKNLSEKNMTYMPAESLDRLRAINISHRFEIDQELADSGHRINGGISRGRGGQREDVLVDFDADDNLREIYNAVEAKLEEREEVDIKGTSLEEGLKGELIGWINDAITEEVKYNKYVKEHTSGNRILVGETIETGGVCRHMGLLVGALLERFIQKGVLTGKVYFVRGKGHAWAVYETKAGVPIVIDIAQHKFGYQEDVIFYSSRGERFAYDFDYQRIKAQERQLSGSGSVDTTMDSGESFTYPGRLKSSLDYISTIATAGESVLDVGVGNRDAPEYRRLKESLNTKGVALSGIELNDDNIPADLRREIIRDDIKHPGAESLKAIRKANIIRISNLLDFYFTEEETKDLLRLLQANMKIGAVLLITHGIGNEEEGFIYKKDGQKLSLDRFVYMLNISQYGEGINITGGGIGSGDRTTVMGTQERGLLKKLIAEPISQDWPQMIRAAGVTVDNLRKTVPPLLVQRLKELYGKTNPDFDPIVIGNTVSIPFSFLVTMVAGLEQREREEISEKLRIYDLNEGDSADKAIKGGIDFNSDKMNLQTRNAGGDIKFNIDPAQLQALQNAVGFKPVIINMQPMVDLRGFLGLNESKSEMRLAKT